ncbi:uncharacterized protein LOC129235585 isoform X1 [Anastrepha obliqua]|uniref:uncharacterized protein LOC129235585 isoform X1 n=1 Tax=Anastrepha obliqua TaxID=95512 RepID=UPI00240A02C9|nr:uncharacterized protein LOC129235585 isoform X1 [Anastrepha obliqua]
MSKFCGVISKHTNAEDFEPLRFSHLEMLTNWLASETESLETDFQTKGEAVQDQQLRVIQNENNLTQIHDIMQTLKQRIAATELEINVNESSIKMLENNIRALEEYAKRPLTPAGVTCGCPLVCRQHQQHNMWNLLQDTDRTMAQLNTLMDEIHELEPYVERMSNPYYTISSILDCHLTTLKQTEANLDRLVDKMNAVDGLFQLMMRHLADSRRNRANPVPPNCKLNR